LPSLGIIVSLAVYNGKNVFTKRLPFAPAMEQTEYSLFLFVVSHLSPFFRRAQIRPSVTRRGVQYPQKANNRTRDKEGEGDPFNSTHLFFTFLTAKNKRQIPGRKLPAQFPSCAWGREAGTGRTDTRCRVLECMVLFSSFTSIL